MNNNVKFITGIAAGLAAGLVLGILFAPDKGSETRRKMAEKGKNFVNDLKEKAYKTKEEWKEKVNDVV